MFYKYFVNFSDTYNSVYIYETSNTRAKYRYLYYYYAIYTMLVYVFTQCYLYNAVSFAV